MNNLTFHLKNEKETEHLAQKLATLSRSGDVIYLKGTLGMGKSFFARAFIRSIAGNKNLEVPSPTFTLVQTYTDLKTPVWHFDLYRLESPEEIDEIGLDEALSSAVSLIEWPERLGRLPFPNTLVVTLEPGDQPEARVAHLSLKESESVSWNDRLKGVSL